MPIKVWPHEYFRIDFDKMLDEGRYQEKVFDANKGEYSVIHKMHQFISNDVMPLIIGNDWVYEAALTFAQDYAKDCFTFLKITGKENYDTQEKLHDIKDQVIDILARAAHDGYAPQADRVDLVKASDFIDLIDMKKLHQIYHPRVRKLQQKAQDHEDLQINVTLRSIRDAYEISLPRIMYVIRRAIKVQKNLAPKPSDNKLTGLSECLNWYEAHVDKQHGLYPVFGNLRNFYKVARNIGSHHLGIDWIPEKNEVALINEHKGKRTTMRMDVTEFSQKNRYIIYICELGLRGILSAFCERERGPISKQLVINYSKTFPEGFPDGVEGIVVFYP